jgi:penicillin G amidase
MRPSLILVVLGALGALAACGAAPEKTPASAVSLPPPAGTLAIDGLTRPVQVARDRWGIPHISAETQDDLFFAQGFVQAQDRLFQMDLWRRSVQGRLSEVLGANFIERDAMTRRMQFRGDRALEWASYGPDVQAIATAFTRGINAWIAYTGDRLPEAFALAGWRPEPWGPEDLLNRTDAFVASGNARAEIVRAQLIVALGVDAVDALFPAASGARTIVPQGLDPAAVSPLVADLLLRVGTRPFFSGFAAPWQLGSGSNAWAVGPSRSATGAPLLAVDPHRPLDSPSLRYLVHLKAPGWNAAGATAPWLPGVVIGHNESVAWGMTALGVDTQDVFIERLNPANSRQILDGSRWIDMTVEKDTIVVKRRDQPFEYERFYTPRGVVVAFDPDRHLAYTVRWSGVDPGGAAELAGLALNRAQSLTDVQTALDRWRMPPAEFVYIDREGHVGLQQAGAVPVRRGWDGALPAPAWSGDLAWSGWTGRGRFRRTADPASGFVASANRSRPRLQQITTALGASRAHSVDSLKRLQHDTYASNADRLIPLLQRAPSQRADVEDVRQRLLRWDRQVSAYSGDAVTYVAWERALGRQLLSLRVPPALIAEMAANVSAVIVPALTSASRAWFGAEPERGRDKLLADALAAAVDEVRRAPTRAVTFTHPLALTEQARRRFNVGPFAIGGYSETVRAFALPAGSGGGPAVGPSFQAIFDASDWDRSVVMNAPGQSEWPQSAHHSDLARLWGSEEYVPLAFSDKAIQASVETTLTLSPKPIP